MPQTLQEHSIIGALLYEWKVSEYEQHSRGIAWYIVMGVGGMLFVLYGIFSSNFLFSLIIILSSIIIFLQSHQAPMLFSFRITELGVGIAARFYPYSELENFYIIYRPPEVKTLYLRPKSTFLPLLRIPLSDMNPVEVRHALREFLTEDTEKEEEPMSDTIARRWKIH